MDLGVSGQGAPSLPRPAGGGEEGCHASAERLHAEAIAHGKAETLARLIADYPKGPHDQPQSMCPAFGSLRVGLRMRRVATVLCGSACCVYGLTFTSHFYGARRSVGYVPFDSESLVTGRIYEDVLEAVTGLADPDRLDAIVAINLCVPTASGVPLDRLPREIAGVRVIGIDVPGFGVPTHAEAKDVLAAAMLRYARAEAETGPVARPRTTADVPTVALVGELFPADPMGIAALLAPLGLAVAPPVPAREWRDLYGALDCRVAAAVHPFYTGAVREFAAAGRPVVGSGPVGAEGAHAWIAAVGGAAGLAPAAVQAAASAAHATMRGALAAHPVRARLTVSGYEGSELLVARALVEAGAEAPYVGTACPKTPWNADDEAWLNLHGCHVQFRASLEQDLAAVAEVRPDLAIGTTPVVQRAKERGVPAAYFTNVVSSRPLFGPAGAASLAAIVQSQTAGRERFGRMVSFFGTSGFTGEEAA